MRADCLKHTSIPLPWLWLSFALLVASNVSQAEEMTMPLSAVNPEKSTPENTGSTPAPEIKSSVASFEAARRNLAELLSGKNDDVPGIKVPTMPATCSETTPQYIQSLGKGGPSHASIGCLNDKVLYAIYASIPVVTTGIYASNSVSVSFLDLIGANVSIKEIPDQPQMDLLKVAAETYNGPPADGRAYSHDVSRRPYQVVLNNGVSFHFKQRENAQAFADSLLAIQSMTKETESEREARFKAKLARYQSGDKPPVTEEQRRLIVQANLLTQRKMYLQALDLYLQALDIDPVAYPDAYFNSALLAAEMERYPMAIDFMKKYLLLLPNGKDARQAQDKIYEWELLGNMAGKP
jgi:tetratricopeptide (TPR) repeat protein